MSETDKLFQSQSFAGSLSLREVLDDITAYIGEKPAHEYQIIIGSDSAAQIERPVSIVTALTVRRVGNGGRYYYMRGAPRPFHHTRDRIYAETMSSITLAQELRTRLREMLGEEVFWCDLIHIDVGRDGLSRNFVDEVVGMVKGFDFQAVIKPDSFAASSVADRHT
jgi:predicted RNase H-related nuclease YkuK (DUF458 family)